MNTFGARSDNVDEIFDMSQYKVAIIFGKLRSTYWCCEVGSTSINDVLYEVEFDLE